MKVLLGVDLGTTNVKVVAYTIEGEKVFEHGEEYPTHYPRHDWAEQDPRDWVKAFFLSALEVIRSVRRRRLEILGMCITSQREGVVPISKEGDVLARCIIWMDQRSLPESEEIARKLGSKAVYEKTGLRPSPTFTASKLLWLKKNVPRVYERAEVFLQPKEFLVYVLTGKQCSDPSLASRTMLFDIRKLEWDEGIAEALGLSIEKMPEVLPSTEIVGYVKDEVARKLELEKPIPVVNGGGDRPCEALGGGIVEKGVAGESTGTATNVMMSVDEPRLDLKGRFLCSGHVLQGKWLLEGGTSPTGAILRWFRDNIAIPEVEEAKKRRINPYDVINEIASKVPPGSEGLLLLPFFMGSKAPRWSPRLRGAFIGLTLGHGRAHIAKSIMEGIAYLCREIIEAYESTGIRITEVRLLGGAAQSILWARIKASVWRKRVLIVKEKSAAALGATILAGIGVGVFGGYRDAVQRMVKIEREIGPVEEWVKVYEGLYERYLHCCDMLEKIFQA